MYSTNLAYFIYRVHILNIFKKGIEYLAYVFYGHCIILYCMLRITQHEKYDYLLDRHDNLSVVLKSPPRRVGALFSHKEVLLGIVTLLFRKESHTR